MLSYKSTDVNTVAPNYQTFVYSPELYYTAGFNAMIWTIKKMTFKIFTPILIWKKDPILSLIFILEQQPLQCKWKL